jgi:glycosyltransferase involved in cell wall biosynthesis
MAAGTPPIVTPVGALPEIVEPLSKELVLADRTAQAIAEGICEILENSELPSDQACRDYVEARFDWKAIAPKVNDVYREL